MSFNLLARTILLGAVVAGCQPRGADRPHMTLGSDLSPLRAAFNRDSGKVRVVMLVAPT